MKLWNGKETPPLGMGCWAIGGPLYAGTQPLGWGEVDDATSIRAIHAALDGGICYFDTAAAYGAGHSEKVLGRALKGRNDIVVSTKFGPVCDYATRQVLGEDVSAAAIRASVDGSLKNLGRDRLDLLFLHINALPLAEAGPVFETLSGLRAEGKIDGFGWSTDDPERAVAFADLDGYVAVQHDMNVFRPARKIRAATDPLGLHSIARQPLGMGFLSDRTLRGERIFTDSDIRQLGTDWMAYFIDGKPAPELFARLQGIRDILCSDGRSVVQGALAWIWAESQTTIPIPGFRLPEQVTENCGALEKGPLTPQQLAEVDAVIAGAA